MYLVAALLLSGYVLAGEGCRAPIVEIVVSPLVDRNTIRVMDIAWEVGSNWRPGDWVGLYNEPPSPAAIPIFRAQANRNLGDVRTGVMEGRSLLEPNYDKICLGWWAAYWHENNPYPVAVSCLSTNPRWMEEHRGEIGNMTINNMFIPGTHDSGALYLAYSPFKDFTRLYKYLYAQDETIMEQLIHGARLLDLRPAVHKNEFWINHDWLSIVTLENVLNDIKTFVENTNEIVILDVHQFPLGFKDQATHNRLIDFIKAKLGHLMAPPHVGWGVTLNQLWNMNKRIIVAYNEKQVATERAGDVFWPVSQKWGDKRKIDDLFGYFNNIFISGPDVGDELWCAMAELTPTYWDVIFDRLNGLRGMADSTNKQITSWFRGDWGNTVNGVSVDFIRSTGIVDAAIRWNRRRAKGKTCD